MINDLISDMINRIMISIKLRSDYVLIFYSKVIFFILKILKNEGYIINFFLIFKNNKSFVIIHLKYFNNKSVIQFIKRISKPSLKIYSSYKKIPVIMNGLGVLILSTNKGIITDKLARDLNLGGELICYVF